MTTSPAKPRVFIDADVLFAGSASSSEHGASLTILRMAEITLIEAIASRQVIVESERNLAKKLPAALPPFRYLVERCLTVVDDPSRAELVQYEGIANASDLPLLVAAIREECPWLTTFNVRHYLPGHPLVATLTPGELLQRVRHLLARL